jgi:2-amino-4-hydroxy-6-hydroxymethyldihydropteridine diphosphokinase
MKRAVFIGLGSNMGDKKANLRRALKEIEERGLGMISGQSSLYLTEPVGMKDQEDFINAAAVIETDSDLKDLLDELLDIEKSMGRERREKDGPRIIDIDILLSGHETFKEEGLDIPHPEIAKRGFVLHPLAEIAPDLEHPVSGLTVKHMLELLDDPARVEKLDEKL